MTTNTSCIGVPCNARIRKLVQILVGSLQRPGSRRAVPTESKGKPESTLSLILKTQAAEQHVVVGIMTSCTMRLPEETSTASPPPTSQGGERRRTESRVWTA
eukprot:1635700-Rhodomonas_salina.1